MRFAFLFLFLSPTLSFAKAECTRLLKREEVAFARKLHERNPGLHTSREVMAEQRRLKRLDLSVTQSPPEKIATFLTALERVHERASLNEGAKERLRASYHRRFIIRPQDIPESYFQHQQRIARERGYGHVEITHAMRTQSAEILISDQKKSLDAWLDYFLSPDAASYPFYVKYWSFTSMLKLSKLDLEAGEFLKRSKSTVAPFPELNREALAQISDQFVKRLKGQGHADDIEDPAVQKLLSEADFGRIYARALKRLHDARIRKTEGGTAVDGVWVKYDQGSDPEPLVRSLQGKNTGWCTAAKSTAAAQLGNGDFHVFYTRDWRGMANEPRVAIRMEGDQIAEVRGVGTEQNLDAAIAESNVVDTKLKEFGTQGGHYRKKDSDMKRLTEVVKKSEANHDLSKEDLRFLYEIDTKIEGFGYGRDPRIEELLSQRKLRTDLAHALGIPESKISFTQEEALRGGSEYHHGNLSLREIDNLEALRLPLRIGGGLDLSTLKSAKGLRLPDTVGGNLRLGGLRSTEGLKLPNTIGGGLDLSGLTIAEGLKLPDTIGGGLYLTELMTAKGLKFPNSLGGHLELPSLTSAEGLNLADTIVGSIDLGGLVNAEGLKLPKTVSGFLDLRGLESAEGLKLPQRIGGSLLLSTLRSAKGVELPDTIGGDLFLPRLTSLEGLKLPDTVEGDIWLPSLSPTTGNVVLPKNFRGKLKRE
jgi:hypothetical protein